MGRLSTKWVEYWLIEDYQQYQLSTKLVTQVQVSKIERYFVNKEFYKIKKDKSNKKFQCKMKYKVVGPIQFGAICPMKNYSSNEWCLIRPTNKFTKRVVRFGKSINWRFYKGETRTWRERNLISIHLKVEGHSEGWFHHQCNIHYV